LILLEGPALVFMHGLPPRFVSWAGELFLPWPSVQRLGRTLTHPVLCWLAAMITLVGWHVPAVFALALRSHSWHEVEYAGFFATGLLFWLPVVQPWPSVARWPGWYIPLYLFLATLPCDALSAFLAFCDRVVYSSYLTAPRLFNLSPLEDQQCAGALMWVCATFIYLIPAVVVTIQILSPSRAYSGNRPEPPYKRSPGRSFAADGEVV
jgi:putative membrane protein